MNIHTQQHLRLVKTALENRDEQTIDYALSIIEQSLHDANILQPHQRPNTPQHAPKIAPVTSTPIQSLVTIPTPLPTPIQSPTPILTHQEEGAGELDEGLIKTPPLPPDITPTPSISHQISAALNQIPIETMAQLKDFMAQNLKKYQENLMPFDGLLTEVINISGIDDTMLARGITNKLYIAAQTESVAQSFGKSLDEITAKRGRGRPKSVNVPSDLRALEEDFKEAERLGDAIPQGRG